MEVQGQGGRAGARRLGRGRLHVPRGPGSAPPNVAVLLPTSREPRGLHRGWNRLARLPGCVQPLVGGERDHSCICLYSQALESDSCQGQKIMAVLTFSLTTPAAGRGAQHSTAVGCQGPILLLALSWETSAHFGFGRVGSGRSCVGGNGERSPPSHGSELSVDIALP